MQTGKYMLMTMAMSAAGLFVSTLQAHANEQTGTTAASQQQQDAGKKQDASKKQVNAKGIENATANMVLVGELVDSRDVTLKGVDEQKHRLLKVKPANGSQTVIVDIGMQDSAASFGLVKGDRVIAVGKSARINDRPVLFAKSIGELYPVGRVGSVARDREQMMQDNSARGASSPSAPDTSSGEAASKNNSRAPANTSSNSGASKAANANAAQSGAASIDPPDTRGVDEIVVWFDSDNLGSDQYGVYDEDFVWVTVDPAYSAWNPSTNATAWNDNRETPHWDVWGYDDADEWGLFDW